MAMPSSCVARLRDRPSLTPTESIIIAECEMAVEIARIDHKSGFFCQVC
jgi:hypothetical protein